MIRNSILRHSAIAAVVVALLPLAAQGRDLLLKKGDRLAVVGDSITEQKQYSRFIEDYLLACMPELELQIFQFGWSGERAPGFANRMDNDLVPWKPTVVTTAFGMNDGSYRPYDEGIGKTYEDGTRRIQDRMKEIGARMVVGGPGPVDLDSWKRDDPDADKYYNDNLGKLPPIRLARPPPFPAHFQEGQQRPHHRFRGAQLRDFRHQAQERDHRASPDEQILGRRTPPGGRLATCPRGLQPLTTCLLLYRREFSFCSVADTGRKRLCRNRVLP